MKAIIAVLAGKSGSGTARLGARVASILDWPFASFGAYVRAESARKKLAGARDELQDTGSGLVRDVEGFCHAVVAQSGWRPGQSLIIDGLRHPKVLKTLRRMFKPTEVIGIYVEADQRTREENLLQRGEFHFGGLATVDRHPVERGIQALRRSARTVLDNALPEANVTDHLLEFLLRESEIPPNQSWITSGNLLYVPAALRQQLGLREGDRMELRAFENLRGTEQEPTDSQGASTDYRGIGIKLLGQAEGENPKTAILQTCTGKVREIHGDEVTVSLWMKDGEEIIGEFSRGQFTGGNIEVGTVFEYQSVMSERVKTETFLRVKPKTDLAPDDFIEMWERTQKEIPDDV